MAMEFAKSVDSKRTSSYSIPPENLHPSPDLNSRVELPDLEAMIASIVRDGQQVPITIRNDGGQPTIVDGRCRWMAISIINEKKLTPVPLRVQCVGFTGNAPDAFKAAIRANHYRNNATPIDDAHNVDRLFKYGMTAEEIAVFYFPLKNGEKPNVSWVKQRHALIGLSPEGEKAVVSGRIKSVSAAKAIAKMSAKQQKELLEKEGKIKPSDISEASGKPQKISLKEVKQEIDDIISEYAAKLPDFINDRLCKLRDRM